MELDHNGIKYITPSKELKEQFYEMKNESYDINEDVSLYGLDDANKYLQLKERPEYIPCSPYWMLDTKHNRLLGSLTIRHHLRNSDDKNWPCLSNNKAKRAQQRLWESRYRFCS